jgi:hypothetical protein
MRRSLSTLLALSAVAALTAPVAADGAAGSALADLGIPEGQVAVIASGVIPSVDGGPATVVAIIGNGTAAPVDPRVAWAATDQAGALLWVGLPAGFTSSGETYQIYAGPETLQPGSIGIAFEEVRDLPGDARTTFAVRAGAPTPEAGDFTVTEVSLEAGHLVGTVTNAAPQPFDLAATWLPVVAVCFDAAGAPISVHATTLQADGAPLEPGASTPFDIDLGGAECDRFLVVA